MNNLMQLNIVNQCIWEIGGGAGDKNVKSGSKVNGILHLLVKVVRVVPYQ